jgi:hypothetical protein
MQELQDNLASVSGSLSTWGTCTLMYPKYINFSKPFAHGFTLDLTIYEINLQNLTLFFIAKNTFSKSCPFDTGNGGNKFGEIPQKFLWKGSLRQRRPPGAFKQDQVARSPGQAAPPRSVWASVADSASPSTHVFIYWKKSYS